MPISVNNIDKVLQALEEDLQRCREAVLVEMVYTGEEAVKLQRGQHGYLDQTGNLTSSIGYMVLDHGRVVSMSNFRQIPAKKKRGRPKGSKKGSAIGKRVAAELAKRYAADDMALIIVAGMDYASHVENMGLNVIDTAELHIHGQLNSRLKKRIKKLISQMNARLK